MDGVAVGEGDGVRVEEGVWLGVSEGVVVGVAVWLGVAEGDDGGLPVAVPLAPGLDGAAAGMVGREVRVGEGLGVALMAGVEAATTVFGGGFTLQLARAFAINNRQHTASTGFGRLRSDCGLILTRILFIFLYRNSQRWFLPSRCWRFAP
jgi:hypothetical protein